MITLLCDTNSIDIASISEECNTFIAGNAARVSGEQTVQLNPSDIVYDDESKTYYAYIITDGVIAGTNYEEVPSGGN